MKVKKILSIILVCTMFLSLMPTSQFQVQAAETEDSEDSNVFNALGFDTSQAPDGYDPDSTENPYGKDLVTANEVLEAFILDDGGYRIAGNNNSITADDISSAAYNGRTFPGSYRSMAAGDFDGDGLAGEMVYVANDSNDINALGNLKMYFIDKGGNSYGPITLVAGKIGHFADEGAGELDWRGMLEITTGDFDADGCSEIAVYVPESGNARVDVYKYKKTGTAASTDWTTASNWSLVWSHAVSSSTVSPNVVSLCAGDLNRDGIDDLAISYGYVKIGFNDIVNTPSSAVALFGSKTSMLQTKQSLSLGSGEMLRAAFTYGDVDGDGAKELVLGAQPATDYAANRRRTVGVYAYDGENVALIYSSVMDVVSGDYVEGKWLTNNGYDGEYKSSGVLACNIAVVSPEALESSSTIYIYLDSVLYSYNSGAFEIEAELDEADIDGDGTGDTIDWYKTGTVEMDGYWEYGAISGDVEGRGADALISNFMGLSSDLNSPTYRSTKIMFSKGGNLTKDEISGNGTACFPNTDSNDTVLMRYTGEHSIVYTDPNVLAVISSAPYFQDIADYDDYYLSYLETSYGQSTGSGGSTITTVSFDTGGYYSLDYKLFQLEASVGFTFEWEREKSKMTEYSVSFNTPGGEDSVAFYSIPTEVYVYELSIPDGEGGYTTEETAIKMPHTAAVQVLNLDYYESIASNYEELPEISGKVLTHTLGDPSTYPSSSDDYNVISQYDGDWAGLSFSEGSISQEISITEEVSNSYNFGASASIRLGGGTEVNQGGWYLNFNAGGGYSEVSITGTTFSGTIKNMPVDMETYGYYFAWKLFSYAYTLNEGIDDEEYSFPVISYLVKDVTSPPTLPTDFAQNYDKTTDSQVALTWSYNKTASYFSVYRYFDFPEGGGSYLVGTVSASDYTIEYDSNGNAYKSYCFIDDDLSPYTEYQYQIQVERNKVPPRSGMSSILSAKTKASSGYPELSITPTLLTVYPDKDEILMVDIANITDYTDNTAKYQWQKFENGIWSDVDGATSSALVFSKAGEDDAGSYRCRVNVITKTDNAAYSAYTNTATVGYSKRSINFSEISAVDTSIGTTLSVNVKNAHSNSGSIPTGTVIFYLNAKTSSITYTYFAQLDATGKAEVDIDSLPQGIYEISGYYSGSRVFKSGYSDKIQYISGIGNGFWMEIDDSATYGDTVSYKVYEMNKDESGALTLFDDVVMSNCEIIIDDQLYTGNIYDSTFDNSFYAGAVGTITLRVYYEDSGVSKYIDEQITIQKQDITLKIPNESGILNEEVNSQHMLPSVLTGKIADSDTSSFYSNIDFNYRNTAGTIVSADNIIKTPGYYTVTSSPNATLNANYNITILDGSYIVTGTTNVLEVSMRKFEGLYNGDIYLISPDCGSSSDATILKTNVVAGTRVILCAVPDMGYTIYDWYINGIAQGKTSTTIAYTMLSENTTIEVQFAIKQNSLTYGTGGDENGGIVKCTTDSDLVSGSVIAQGTEITFMANPNSGYHFVEWRYTAMGSTTTYTQGIAGENGSSTYTMTMPASSADIYAVFERDSYMITLSEGLTAVYTGDHDNDATTPDQEISIVSGDYIKGDKTVKVMSKSGYVIDDTAAWLLVGSQGASSVDNSSYAFVIDENTYVQMAVIRVQYLVKLGFADKDICAGSILTYRIDNQSPITISGDSYTDMVDIPVPGGSSLYIEASVCDAYDFVKWVKTVGTIETEITGLGCNFDSVVEDFSIQALFKDKSSYSVTLGSLTESGASYSVSVNGEDYKDAAESDIINAIEEDSLSVRVNVPLGKVVGYWNVDGQSLQSTSNTYTFNNIIENHTIAPVFTSMIFCTVSWEEVSTAINGCTIVPESGYLSLVSAGSNFKFKVTAVEGLSIESVYTNDILLTPDVSNVYTISNITKNQVIKVVLADLGVTVSGTDIKNISGSGWKYNIDKKELYLSAYGLTVSGAMKVADQKFSMIIDSSVSTVMFENLSMDAINVTSAITSLRGAGLTVTLVGENKVALKYYENANNKQVFSAKKLTFSENSTGSLDLTIDFPDGVENPATVCGIMAESLVIKGGTINIFAKNDLDRHNVNDDIDVYGIKTTGVTGITMSGGKLNIGAYAHFTTDMYDSIYSYKFPDVYGIYAESGNMTVTGGDLSVLSSGSIANCEAYGIKLDSGKLEISGNSNVEINSFGGSYQVSSYGIAASDVSVIGGLLEVNSGCIGYAIYDDDYTTSCGIELTAVDGKLENTGGIMEIVVSSGDSRINLGKLTVGSLKKFENSSWTVGNGIVILAGDSELDAYERDIDEYLALVETPNYLKVCAMSTDVDANVTISTDDVNYESIYPEIGLTEKTGTGWIYSADTLTLNDLTKSYYITGTDKKLNIVTDNSNYGTANITINNLHASQLSLIGKNIDSASYPEQGNFTKVVLTVRGENTLNNNSSVLEESPIYVKDALNTTIVGDGTLTAVNHDSGGYAVGIDNNNSTNYNFCNIVMSIEGGTLVLYGGKATVGEVNNQQAYNNSSSISIPFDLYGTVMKAEEGSSPSDAVELTEIQFNDNDNWQKYLKIYLICTAPTVNPTSASFDKNGEAGNSFDITYPVLGDAVYEISEISMDENVISTPTTGVTVNKSSTTAVIILSVDYLQDFSVGTHNFVITFENNDTLNVPITIIDSTIPEASANILVASAINKVYKGESLMFTATLSELISIGDTSLEWTVTGKTSVDTRIENNDITGTATLYAASDETSSELEISAKLKNYPLFVSNTADVSVETKVSEVNVEPESVTLFYKKDGENTQQFNAVVKAINNDVVSQNVQWTLWGRTKIATIISDDGMLTVSPDETGYNGLLTLKAKSEAYPYVESNLVNINLSADSKLSYNAGNYGSISSATYKITDGENKSIASGDFIPEGSQVTITANPSSGYKIRRWMVNGVASSQIGNTLVFTTQGNLDYDVSAEFSATGDSITFGATGNGTVGAVYKTSTGTYAKISSGTKLGYSTNVIFTSAPSVGYEITAWYINGTLYNEEGKAYTGTEYSFDYSTDSGSGVDVQVIFAAEVVSGQYTINYGTNGMGGTITTANGNGTQVAAGDGDKVLFKAVPDTEGTGALNNYQVEGWYANGSIVQSGGNEYTLTVTNDTAVMVKFERADYTVTYASDGNGTVNGNLSGTITAAAHCNVELTASPSSGYQVKGWSIDGSNLFDLESPNCTISSIGSDVVVHAVFENIPEYLVTIKTESIDNGVGSVTAKVEGADAVEDASSIQVNNHGTVTLTSVPAQGNYMYEWKTEGASDTFDCIKSGNTMMISNIRGDITAIASFKPELQVTVTCSATTTGGAIKSSRAGYGENLKDIDAIGNSAIVTAGMKVVFTAEPDNAEDTLCVWNVIGTNGNKLDSLAYTISSDTNTLTLVPIDQNLIVTVAFETSKYYNIEITPDADGHYTILTAGKTPSYGSDNQIRKGGTVLFTVTPSTNFELTDITATGGNVTKAINSNSSYAVTVSNVATDVAIKATSKILSYAVTYSDTITGGTLSIKDANGNNITNSSAVPYGTVMTITATANKNYELSTLTVNETAFTSGNTFVVTKATSILVAFKYVEPASGGGGGGVAVSAETYTIVTTISKGGNISPSSAKVIANESKAFVITPDEGYEISSILIDGKEIELPENLASPYNYTFENVMSDHTMEVDFKEIAYVYPSTTFADVDITSWYYEYVKTTVEKGLLKGTSEDTFEPNAAMTRSMIVTMLWRLEGNPEAKYNDFEDVEEGTWYSEAVSWANNNGIVLGYGNGHFKPSNNITREEIAATLYRYAQFKGFDVTKSVDISQYEDKDKICFWALNNMKWANAEGFITGRTKNTLVPGAEATRAEVAAMVCRFINKYGL
ncbi:MAG: S-layer homology domain-containing protein [Sedimentibacter sp.]